MIETVQVFGARASGTNYFHDLAVRNLLDVDVTTTHLGEGYDNYGWKHGAIGGEVGVYVDEAQIVTDGTDYLRREDGRRIRRDDPRYVGVDRDGDPYIKNNATPVDDDALLVVLYRNPIRWLQSLQRQPHHAHELYGVSFADFLTRRWRTYMSAPGAEFSPDAAVRQHWVQKGAVIEDEPSIFAHRAHSIARFEKFRDQAPNVAYMNYEALRRDPSACLGALATHFGMALKTPFENTNSYKGHGSKPFIETNYAPIAKADLLRILHAVDWSAEAAANYSPAIDYAHIAKPEDIPDAQIDNPLQVLNFNPVIWCYRDGVLLAAERPNETALT